MSTNYYTETYQSNIVSPFSLVKIPMQAFSPHKSASLMFTTITQSEMEETIMRRSTEIFPLRIHTTTIETHLCQM